MSALWVLVLDRKPHRIDTGGADGAATLREPVEVQMLAASIEKTHTR